MSDPQSQIAAQAAGAALPTGTQIYDAIMGEIEPELVSAVIPTLEDTYKEETADEHEARMKRYEEAFSLYDRCYQAYMDKLTGEVRDRKRSARAESEQHEQAERDQEAEAVLAQIANV